MCFYSSCSTCDEFDGFLGSKTIFQIKQCHIRISFSVQKFPRRYLIPELDGHLFALQAYSYIDQR